MTGSPETTVGPHRRASGNPVSARWSALLVVGLALFSTTARAEVPKFNGATDDAAAVPVDAGAGGSEGRAAVDGGVAQTQAPTPTPIDPSAPTVGASLDRSEAHVGDVLTLTVTAIAADSVTQSVTLEPPALGKLELLDRSTDDRQLGDGRTSRRFVLRVAAYEVGELEVPPLTLSYSGSDGRRHELRTESLPLRLRPVVDEAQPKLAEPRAPREVMVEDRRPLWVLVGLGALLGAALLGLLARAIWRRRLRRAQVAAEAEEQRAPDEVALERLRALRARGGFGSDGYQPFHFAVSEVVRAYVGGRWGFGALEQTTTELLDELARLRVAVATEAVGTTNTDMTRDAAMTPTTEAAPAPTKLVRAVDATQLDVLRRLLEACDLVKFAKLSSTDEACLALLAAAEAFVLETREAAPGTMAAKGREVAHG